MAEESSEPGILPDVAKRIYGDTLTTQSGDACKVIPSIALETGGSNVAWLGKKGEKFIPPEIIAYDGDPHTTKYVDPNGHVELISSTKPNTKQAIDTAFATLHGLGIECKDHTGKPVASQLTPIDLLGLEALSDKQQKR